MSEVLALLDNVERSTRIHMRTHESAGVATSTPEYDRNTRLPHPVLPWDTRMAKQSTATTNDPRGIDDRAQGNVGRVQVNARLGSLGFITS